jgi:hypothetical protein
LGTSANPFISENFRTQSSTDPEKIYDKNISMLKKQAVGKIALKYFVNLGLS